MNQFSLEKYLELEQRTAGRSLKKWNREVNHFNRVLALYDECRKNIYPTNHGTAYSSLLFLDIYIQMFGAAAPMLRRKIQTAFAQGRRSIESMAYAYFLAMQPDLCTLFLNGLPSLGDYGHPRQFRKSKELARKFELHKFFDQTGGPGKHLRFVYESCSAFGVHVNQTLLNRIYSGDVRDGSGEIFLHLLDGQRDEDMVYGWHFLTSIYLDGLGVLVQLPNMYSADIDVKSVLERIVQLNLEAGELFGKRDRVFKKKRLKSQKCEKTVSGTIPG